MTMPPMTAIGQVTSQPKARPERPANVPTVTPYQPI